MNKNPPTKGHLSAGLLRLFSAALFVLLAGCQDIGADLKPSAADHRPEAQSGKFGSLPGERAADFAISDSQGTTVRLSDHLAGGSTPADAVVLYFTMWCPICTSHSDHLIYAVVPQFAGRGTVRYYLIDYVTGSVEGARSAERANGYAGSALVTLADIDQAVYRQFEAAMGTVVVIDGEGTIQLNEDYRDGKELAATLDRLLAE